MRVVHVLAAPWPSPQGTQVAVAGTLVGLAPRLPELLLLTYGHGGPGPGAPCAHLRVPSPPGYRRLRSGPDPVKPFCDLALAARLAALRADVVHAHHVEALAAALLARAWTGVPVVYEAHTRLGEELPAYLPALRGPARLAGTWADRALPRRADAVVALSRRAAAAFRAEGCARVCHLPVALDPGALGPPAPGRPPGPPRVVYAGNDDAYQDLGVLEAAMAHLPGVVLERLPPHPWARVRERLAAAHVAVVPRAVCAGTPVKRLNALALGVPVVVTDGVGEGLPGEVVVTGRDPKALAAGVRRALALPRPDPARARARHDPASRAEGLLRIYAELSV